LLKAVRHHTDCPWVLLYIERWLKAPVRMEESNVVPRRAGTPQGGVISPLLANLFLHYAFDTWMSRHFRGTRTTPFEGARFIQLIRSAETAGDQGLSSKPLLLR
jgi:retron-type reverse transcriptase